MTVAKFTRLGAAEGDVLYATTVGGAKSIQSLENNIDAALMTLLGYNHASGTSSSASETSLGQVVYSANSANSKLVILASISANASVNASATADATFRIRTGTNVTPSSNTQRDIISMGDNQAVSTSAVPRFGGMLMAVITSSDETFTSNFYIDATVICTVTGGASISGSCNWIVVFGI